MCDNLHAHHHFYSVPSIRLQCTAAIIRAAWQTLHSWEYWSAQCVIIYTLHYWPRKLAGPSPQPAWCTAPPHVVLLHDAAKCVVRGVRYSSALLHVHSEFRHVKESGGKMHKLQRSISALLLFARGPQAAGG